MRSRHSFQELVNFGLASVPVHEEASSVVHGVSAYEKNGFEFWHKRGYQSVDSDDS